jgi:hypothetical protein
MRMLRTIRLGADDDDIFPSVAGNDEAAVSGGFTFNFGSVDAAVLSGKERRAFVNGFLGLTSFGRASLVVVSECKPSDYVYALDALTKHLLEVYGAPSLAEARRVAEAELAFAKSLCDQPVNTLLSLTRVITDNGIEESYAVHDSRPLWERDTRIFTPIPDSGLPATG